MTIAGAVFVHLGANVINDYFDHLNGSDEVNREYVKGFTGGSMLIQNGLMSHREVLAGAIFFLATGFAVILYFTFQFGSLVLLGGIAAVLSAVAYSMFAGSFYVGELLVAACFGLLIPAGAFYVQMRALTPVILLPSIVPSALVFLILFINEIPDCTADRLCGKKTLVVRIGRKGAAKLYCFITALLYIYLIFLAKAVNLPAILLSFFTFPLAAYAAAILLKHYEESGKLGPALKATILLYIVNVLILTGAYAARSG
jgi:1,4-dihydroxy-2-naphthoate octaprenyltransferase